MEEEEEKGVEEKGVEEKVEEMGGECGGGRRKLVRNVKTSARSLEIL